MPALPDNEKIRTLAQEPRKGLTQQTILDQQEYADQGASG
jgi:hypothetical protein